MSRRGKRFADTHLGARRGMGQAGTIDFPYISYGESNAANYLELASILAVIIGMGMMYAFYDAETGLRGVCIRALAIFAVNRALALLAWLVNNVSVRRKIMQDAHYARIFAVKYPEQAYLCRELNEMYAANPDAVPEEEIRAEIEAAETDGHIKVRIVGYVLFAFFLLLSAAFIGFLIWAYRETI